MSLHDFNHMMEALPKCIINYVKHAYRGMFTNKYSNLKRYKNIHEGERCFIVGTGPSLTIEDVTALQGEHVFLCNYGITLCDQLPYQPDYYVIGDPRAYDEICNHFEMQRTKEMFLVDMSDYKTYMKKQQGTFNTEWIHLPGERAFFYVERFFKRNWSFSFDISKAIFSGASVVYYCYQLAAYMGFKEIYLLGMDCDYSGEVQHFITFDKTGDSQLKMNSGYYHDNFIKMHYCAAINCYKKGISIFNVSRGGKLELFERKNLDEVVGNHE